jgi:hypothetical protein
MGSGLSQTSQSLTVAGQWRNLTALPVHPFSDLWIFTSPFLQLKRISHITTLLWPQTKLVIPNGVARFFFRPNLWAARDGERNLLLLPPAMLSLIAVKMPGSAS